MKNFIKISVLALLPFVACTRGMEPDRVDGGSGLELRFECAAPRVKSVGEDVYGENIITHADCFFYSTASTSVEAVYSVRVTGISGATESDPVAQARIILDDTPLETQGTFWVYVIANLPETSSTAGGTSVEALQQLTTDADFRSAASPFVMDSALTEVTIGDGLSEATVKMQRLAAKITVETEVDEEYLVWEVNAAGDSTLVETWTPVVENMSVYLVHGVSHASLSGTPAVYSEAEKDFWFSYSSDDEGPFYTYPQQWEHGQTSEPYIKVILPWIGSQTGLKRFYYKILLPETDTIGRNCWYQLALHISILGSETDDEALEITGEYHVVDWSGSDDYSGMDLSKIARYLSTPQRSYSIYSTDTLSIPVTSSHLIDVEVLSVRRMSYAAVTPTEQTVTTTYTVDKAAAGKFSVEAVGKTAVAFYNQLSNDLNDDFDCTPITFTLRIRHTDGRKSLTVTVVQYPAIYINAERSNGTVWVHAQSYDVGRQGNSAYGTASGGGRFHRVYANSSNWTTEIGSITRPSDALSSSTNNNPNQYSIKVSVLPQNSEYTLAEVRGGVKSMSPLTGLSQYLPTDRQAGYKISPYFKIASSYGKTIALTNYDRAEMRCAAYQENGYPAGRWRVPTPGEIYFVVSLSQHGLIPSLFDGHYWASDGTLYESNSGQFVTTGQYDVSRGNGVRCVYDLWYWGEEPLSNTTAWGGYHD